MATIGLFPDFIEQECRKGVTDDMLQTMYRGVEGYVCATQHRQE